MLVLGAGPAGLAAADALAAREQGVLVLEKSAGVGGLARTVQHNGVRFDIGGHRFFTRYERVQRLWQGVLGDELLERQRQSRILYRGALLPYPLDLSATLRALGPVESARCAASYGRARLRRHPPAQTFEDWVSARFGRRLYNIFFRTYTEKVWGIPCSEISADWAAQRIKSLSLGEAVRNALSGGGEVTSLIDTFHYPRLGPGQMYDALARRVEGLGGEVRLQHEVVELHHNGERVDRVVVEHDGARTAIDARHILSSMPLTSLVRCMRPEPPAEVLRAADALSFRHFIAVCLVVRGADLFPDNWLYVHDPDLRVGRIQNQGNWSPDLVPQPGHSAITLEYFASEGDDLWTASDAELVALAQSELRRSGLCDPPLVDSLVIRAPRAYPVYRMGYERPLQVLIDWLGRFDNLQPIGRYGMFKYNNSDHSILTALLAVDNLLDGAGHDVWSVNSDESYHEGGGRPVS